MNAKEWKEGNFTFRHKNKKVEAVKYLGNSDCVEIPVSVSILGNKIFKGCDELRKIILNEGLELFDENSFSDPVRNGATLERIFIPSTVNRIELSGANGVLGGKVKYYIHEGNPNYYMDDEICYEAVSDGQYRVMFCQNKKAERVIINDDTVSIAKYAFSALDPTGWYCEYTVDYFTRLKEIEFPSSLKTIDEGAFMNCTALESVTIGSSVEHIDSSAFLGCKKLKKISVSPDNPYYSDIDGVLFDKEKKLLIIYPEGRKASKYEMPDSVEDFGRAFANVDCIKSLYLSDSIKRIVREAFPNTCKIETIYVKSDFTDIDPCAFGEEAYQSRTREKAIEVYIGPNTHFAGYVQEVMKCPKGDVALCDESDTPETKRIKKQFAFKQVEDGLCITAFLEPSHGKKSSPTITIPAKLGEQPIVEMGDGMFGHLSYGIETIIVPEGIKRIGASVFFGHSNLTKIVLPASVEAISPSVFSDKSKKFKDLYLRGEDLVIVVEPDSYAEKFLEKYRFKEYSQPRIIVNGGVPDYLKMILQNRAYTAKLQKGLEPTDRMIVPNTYRGKPVKKVILCEDEMWGSLPEPILALSIPENVKSIVGLTKLRIMTKTIDNIPCINVADDNAAFWSDGIALYSKNKKTLIQLIDYTIEEYTVCEEAKIISKNAFFNCTLLKKITLSKNTQTLEKQAFCGCSSLAEIIGLENVKEAGNDALSGTAYEANCEYMVIGTTLTKYNGTREAFIVPEGVKTIGEGAFKIYSFGKKVTDSLREVTLPSTIEAIFPGAFYGRNGLVSINLPEGLLKIGKDAFSGCDSLKSIHIPSTVTELSPDTFSGAWNKDKSQMAEIDVSNENPKYCSVNNVLYDKAMTEILYIPANAQIEELIIPSSVKKIRGAGLCNGIKRIVFSGQLDDWNDAFSGCVNLTDVSFECSQEKIADYAFCDCKKLKAVTLPTDLREIGNSAFKKTKLKNVLLPEMIEHIGEEAFGESGLKKASLPKSVKTLGWGAFSCVPEIEVYDTIDPDANDADKKIDTVNGSPNSLVGYIGMGPANAMWECAANHRWVNYTIVVKSAQTDEVKYKVWMGVDKSQRQYYCFLSSAWGHNASFAFSKLDEFFSKIRGAEHKLQVAKYRLEYPVDLSDEARKKYEAYVKKNTKKGE